MQKFNSNTKIIIGVDHGYGNMKTAHNFFPVSFVLVQLYPFDSSNRFVAFWGSFWNPFLSVTLRHPLRWYYIGMVFMS